MISDLPADILSERFSKHILNLACEIQAIPAPTFNEGQRADYFINQFQRLKLQDVQRDSVGNVLARLPGAESTSARPVVLSAHMDTVFPLEVPLTLQRWEDRIIGPGIGDNAIGLAALLGLAQMLKERNIRLPGDLWLVANMGEEGLGDLRGIQAVVNRFGDSPLAYLVIEGMGLGTILHRGLGVERYRITIQTPGGHSWVDYGQPSAIHELCQMVSTISGYELPKTPCTTLNVGVIQGGTSINTIAALAWLELDLRSEESAVLAGLVQKVHQLAAEFGKHPDVSVDMKRIGKRLAGQLPAKHPLVKMGREVLAELGIQARLDIASTDANLPLSRGYPSICIGITSGNNAHTQDEFILTAPIARGMAQLYLLVTRAWDQLH